MQVSKICDNYRLHIGVIKSVWRNDATVERECMTVGYNEKTTETVPFSQLKRFYD